MKAEDEKFYGIFFRYLLIVLSAFPSLYIFYLIFTPLTVYGVYFLFSLFFPVILLETNLLFGGDIVISIIPGCVAGAAYYLLFMLNMSVPNIKFSKRISLIFIIFFFFFVFNVIRIFFLGILYIYDFSFFDLLHKILWYFGSIFLTVGMWFLEVYFFKIKEVPFYSDLKFLYKKSFFGKK